MQTAGASIVDVRCTNSTEQSFNGKLEYLSDLPAYGYVSKQYCAVKEPQLFAKDLKQVGA
jgi:hypothetical protein